MDRVRLSGEVSPTPRSLRSASTPVCLCSVARFCAKPAKGMHVVVSVGSVGTTQEVKAPVAEAEMRRPLARSALWAGAARRPWRCCSP